ncbi:helicase domino isoform X3 [Folsomia candida]|uniref:helicase domino isoform X3 n=1 Tax=Folsomia candida TaxID=158441 RepID=UPI000B8F17F1|nr:helicase domino isoform X3 [Folsomia candida]
MSSTPVPVMGTITTPSSSSSSVTSSAAPGANGPLQNGADGDGQMATTTPQFHTPFPSMQHLREEMFLPGDPIFQNSEVDELRTRMESESSTDPVTSLLRPNRGVHTMEQKSGSYNKIPFVRGNKVIKKRILGRRKKELNSLLCDLAKELLTQYTYTALLSDDHARIGSGGSDGVSSVFPPTSEHSNSVRTCVEAMNSLSFRPFRTFLKEHDHTTPLLNEDTLRKLLFFDDDLSRITHVPEPCLVADGITITSSSAVRLVPSRMPMNPLSDRRFLPVDSLKLEMNQEFNQKAASFDQTLKMLSDIEQKKKKISAKPPKKYSEKMKAEASIIQRIQELQKEGMWYDKRLPKLKEPERVKLHRDYLIEEALWMQIDFQQERKWKQIAAKKISKAIRRHFKQKQLAAERALKEDEIRKRRMCSFIAREIQKFWGNVKKVIELQEQSKIEDLKKKALDQQLSFIVDQTEKYSGLLAEKFQSVLKRERDVDLSNNADVESLPNSSPNSDDEFQPRSGSEDDEETIAKAESEAKSSEINKEVKLLEMESLMEMDDFLDVLPKGYLESRMREIETDTKKPGPSTSSRSANAVVDQSATEDDEFTLPSDSESDEEDTIDREEAIEEREGGDHQKEIDELNADAELSLEEIKAKYQYKNVDPDESASMGSIVSDTSTGIESESETPEDEEEEEEDADDSTTEDMTVSEEETPSDTPDTADMVQEDENDSGLASLLQTFAPERAADVDDEDALNSVAALAESFQPKGYTLSSTTVVTKIPFLIKHTLREYQHIGLDWLVTMCDKKLNGILADEMGLGKTIQTIALLAHLACEKGNWGPHLIVVPTSVMLNWEMEFKKWCPGFKILTYYGSQKERKLKRTGWTKQNSFHVCITSYKLVIQDHQSFRRKRWKYLILDEAQNIKNFKSQRWQLLLNFNAQRRLLLTGTPLQNNLMELWSLMHFLMPNVFQSHREFRDWFSNPVSGMVEGSAEYNDNIIRRLHKVLRPFILRRLKSEVEKQLPKKYEHLVMCRLSKRQRYLYEEFMSRTRTKDTLNSGNLLSVINILMQLRKVCNHPNLFEPRPVISPMQSDGVVYYIPSMVWNILDELLESKPSYPVFHMTEADLYFSKEEAWRIQNLAPHADSQVTLSTNSRSRDRATGLDNGYANVCTLKNMSKIQIFNNFDIGPPRKRPKLSFIDALDTPFPPPMPRLNSPIPFFLSVIDPATNGLLDDSEFVDYVGQRSHKTKIGTVLNAPLFNGELEFVKPKIDNGGKIITTELNHITDAVELPTPDSSIIADPEKNSEEDDEMDESSMDEEVSEDSDGEIVIPKKKMKLALTIKKNGTDGILAMGINPTEFQLPEIQERSIINRRVVVSKLERINRFRCEINPVYGQSTLEHLEIFPSRLQDRRQRCAFKLQESPKHRGFELGYGEVERVVRAKLRNELPPIPNHPYLLGENTKTLCDMIPTLEERLEIMKPILSRYVIYIPSVTAPLTQSKVFRPAPSRYFKELFMEREMKDVLQKPCELIHPIVSCMSTQFPDPRLIQYDCGKLQTLDRLLRQLKLGSHRVLIFTQMARMLDVLEAFLNYHGHIYLRLDGATRIDQRQLLMERFNTDKRIFCFILSTRSGGVGVNLTGADTVIFYDSDWNPTMDAQAQDRCHRIGQTRDVHIYRLVSEKTVEENILKKSNQKRMLGEIAIEGASFNTAFFTKNTIHDLFTVDHQENDPRKRLAELASGSLSYQDTLKLEEGDDIRPTGPTHMITSDDSSEDKNAIQILENALLTAEDDIDVQASQTVRAEAAAELAEFDETISLDELDSNPQATVTEAPKSEIEEIFEQLNPVEMYAIRWMENCMEDWASETYANAEKDIEKQKQEWEDAQQRHLQELEMAEQENDEDDSEEEEEDMVTYLSIDAKNKVWIAQNSKNEIIMPIWCPPTPPEDVGDVYIEKVASYLYKQEVIPEFQLPPIHVPPKHPKKQSPASILSSKASYERSGEFPMDIGEMEESFSKKSPSKVARRDEPIFAPRSLFDRPSPALAKLRRDYRLQKYSCRPTAPAAVKNVLGPGSVTFPIIPSPSAKPPPAPPADMAEWMVAEDYALLQTIQSLLELPLSLLVVNLAQTPNWELAAEIVNMTSRTYRTAKHCKWRYENIVGPREEGKLLYDSPCLSPTSPTKKSKKAKTFIKITPPSPSKAARYLKTSQLVAQDNNSQLTNFFLQKFETIKSTSIKKAPVAKVVSGTPMIKTSNNKQAAIFSEHGINYDSPMLATSIAQSRIERLTLERKKILQQQQVQTGSQAQGTTAHSVSSQSPTISMALAGSSQPASPIGSPTPVTPMTESSKLTRATFPPSVSTASGLVPLVLGTSTGEVIARTNVTGSTLAAGQKRQLTTLTPQQQQQYLLQQKLQQQQQQQQQQSQIQQALSSPVQTHQVIVSQPTASLQVAQGVMASQQVQGQILRTTQALQQTQTVVLPPGLAQALGAAVGATVTVSSSGTMSIATTGISTATASALSKNIATINQQHLQRMTSVGLQDIISPGVTHQGTLMSLTPVQSPQLTTKLIQGTQGLATFAQAPPRATSGTILNASPAQAPTASQQQAQQMKEQAHLQQLKRIQVVTSGSQSPGTGTQTASGLALQGVTLVQTSPVFTQATAASGLTASTLTAAQKAPMMTLASAPMGTVATVVNQGSPRQVQNVVKLQPSNATGQQMATFVKTTGAGGQQHGGALAFPLQLSQVKTVNKLGGNAQKQQQTVAQQIQHLSPFQQQILLQRQKQQQQQQQQQMLQANTASKIAQLGQQAPTQLIAVQASPKQLQSGVSVPQFQQVFKQVSSPGQVISSGGQLIHANVLTKPMTLQNVTTSTGTTQIISASTTPSSIISVPSANYATPQQGVTHARLISVNQSSPIGVKQPGLLGNLARPAMPTTTHMSPTIQLLGSSKSDSQIRIQGGTLTTLSTSPMSVPPSITPVVSDAASSSSPQAVGTPIKISQPNASVVPTPPPTPTTTTTT